MQKKKFIKDVLKEGYTGFGLTHRNNKLPNFNQTFAYFKASNDRNHQYFGTTDSRIFNYQGHYSNQDPEILNGNLFIIFIEAGTNNLDNFINTMKVNKPGADKKDYYNELLNVLKELLNIKIFILKIRLQMKQYILHIMILNQLTLFLNNKLEDFYH